MDASSKIIECYPSLTIESFNRHPSLDYSPTIWQTLAARVHHERVRLVVFLRFLNTWLRHLDGSPIRNAGILLSTQRYCSLTRRLNGTLMSNDVLTADQRRVVRLFASVVVSTLEVWMNQTAMSVPLSDFNDDDDSGDFIEIIVPLLVYSNKNAYNEVLSMLTAGDYFEKMADALCYMVFGVSDYPSFFAQYPNFCAGWTPMNQSGLQRYIMIIIKNAISVTQFRFGLDRLVGLPVSIPTRLRHDFWNPDVVTITVDRDDDPFNTPATLRAVYHSLRAVYQASLIPYSSYESVLKRLLDQVTLTDQLLEFKTIELVLRREYEMGLLTFARDHVGSYCDASAADRIMGAYLEMASISDELQRFIEAERELIRSGLKPVVMNADQPPSDPSTGSAVSEVPLPVPAPPSGGDGTDSASTDDPGLVDRAQVVLFSEQQKITESERIAAVAWPKYADQTELHDLIVTTLGKYTCVDEVNHQAYSQVSYDTFAYLTMYVNPWAAAYPGDDIRELVMATTSGQPVISSSRLLLTSSLFRSYLKSIVNGHTFLGCGAESKRLSTMNYFDQLDLGFATRQSFTRTVAEHNKYFGVSANAAVISRINSNIQRPRRDDR